MEYRKENIMMTYLMKNIILWMMPISLCLLSCSKEAVGLTEPSEEAIADARKEGKENGGGEGPEPVTVAFFDNSSIWRDTDNNPIWAQGGNILQVESVYHWFGMEFPIWQAVNHYTSSDLVNWTKQSPALTPAMESVPFGATQWVGRPYVMWNPNTSLYVMIIEWNASFLPGRNNLCFFTSSSIDGPWEYHESKQLATLPDINGNQYSIGDLGMHVEGNTAYMLYTFDKEEANHAQAILKMDTDFMTPLPPTPENYVEFHGVSWEDGGVQEAAAIVKRGDIYYYFTSHTRGWLSSETRYRTSTTGITGANTVWSDNAIVPTLPFSENSFNTQHDFILTVSGTEATTYIYCGDRWNNMNDNVGGTGNYSWFPLTFDDSEIPVPTIHAPAYEENGGDWSLDLVTGEWSPGAP